jgi:hypothetical protein
VRVLASLPLLVVRLGRSLPLLIRREGVVKILPFIFLAIHATFEDEKGDYSKDEDEECEGDNDCLDDDFCLCVHVGC